MVSASRRRADSDELERQRRSSGSASSVTGVIVAGSTPRRSWRPSYGHWPPHSRPAVQDAGRRDRSDRDQKKPGRVHRGQAALKRAEDAEDAITLDDAPSRAAGGRSVASAQSAAISSTISGLISFLSCPGASRSSCATRYEKGPARGGLRVQGRKVAGAGRADRPCSRIGSWLNAV